MQKEEYERLKGEIISKYGQPVFDLHDPQNESATKLKQLQTAYRLSKLADARAKAKEAGKHLKPEGLAEIAQEAKTAVQIQQKRTDAKYTPSCIPELHLNEKDLIAFTEKEIEVIRRYFERLDQSPKEIAAFCGVNYQFVTALLASPSFKILYSKVFDHILPFESLLSIRSAMKGGDSKTALRIAEHYGLIKSEKMDISINKPVDDPEAIKLLKQLGDKL